MPETPSLFASGTSSQTVSSTPTILSAPNIAGLFSFHIDLTAMAAGDVLEVYLNRIVLSGGTVRGEALLGRFTGAQPTLALVSSWSGIGNDLAVTNALQFAIAQTFGTARALPWKVLQY